MPNTELYSGELNMPVIDHCVINLIRPNLESGPWIAGGAAIRWLQGQLMNGFCDVDVFFRDRTQFENLDQQLQTQIFREFPDVDDNIFERFAKNFKLSRTEPSTHKCQQLFRSDNAITYGWNGYRIQLIHRSYYENVDALLTPFDIIASKIATDGSTWVSNHPKTIKHIQDRVLDMADPLQPSAIKRFLKYWVYGYQPVPELIERLQNCDYLETDFTNSNDYDHI